MRGTKKKGAGKGATEAKAKRIKTRDRLWPSVAQEIFDPNHARGFSRVPRVVPLIGRLLDSLRTHNTGGLYQVLWCHDWGDGIIEIRSTRALLYEAGYTSTTRRTERTWQERLDVLLHYGFIRSAAYGLDQHYYLLLIDPYLVVARLELLWKTGITETTKEWFPYVQQTDLPPLVKAMPDWIPQFELICEQWNVDLDDYRSRCSASSGGASS